MLRNGRPSIIIQSIVIESAPPALGRGGVPYLLVNVMQIKPIMILSAALTLAASGTAFAHAELQSSAPQKNAVLNSPPSEVAIDFSEEVNPKLSRIRVKDVVIWHERQGMSPAEIVSGWPHLTLASVYAALAYYHDHREEINAELAADQAWYEEQKARQPSLVQEKLKSSGARIADFLTRFDRHRAHSFALFGRDDGRRRFFQ